MQRFATKNLLDFSNAIGWQLKILLQQSWESCFLISSYLCDLSLRNPAKKLFGSNMTMKRNLLDDLNRADEVGHVALTRYLCEQVLVDDPVHGPVLIRYAACLSELSLYEDATAALDRAEQVVPYEWRRLVLAQRGHLQKLMGNYADAEMLFISAHEHAPNDATYLIHAGSAAFARGDISRAESLARKALECSEGCLDEAYFNLGGYLLAQKKHDEARGCYLHALEIDPDYRIAKSRLEDLDRLLKYQEGGQADVGLPAIRPRSKSEDSDKPQPELEENSR